MAGHRTAASEPLAITEDDPTEEASQPKPQREVWTATFHHISLPLADPMGEKRVNVVAPNFRRAALKADNHQRKNLVEYRLMSLIYSPDTVI